MPCHASYFIFAHVMLPCYMLMVRTTCWYAHEPNLTIDQVPPNRALFVQPQLPVRAGLHAVYRWASLTRIHQSGKASAAVAFGRVNGGSLDSQYVLGPSPFGTSFVPRDGWSHAMVVSGGHRATQGMTYVGDAVRETRGISVSLEMSSSLLTGLVPRILWDRFRGFWAKEKLHVWVTCTNSAESKIYLNSRVLGHGTQFVLGHTRSTRIC